MKIKGIYHMPGSKFLWYRWQENGKRHAVSLKTDDLPEAIRKAQEIKDGRAIVQWSQPQAHSITLATKAVDDYLAAAQSRAKQPLRPRTARKQKSILAKFLRDANITAIHQITLKTCQGWLQSIVQSGASKDTQHTYGRALKTFVGYLVDRRLAISTDLPNFDIPERGASGRKNWLKMDVANRVISNAEDEDLRFVLFCGFHTGLRKSEIIAARVGWFDLDAGLLHVQNDPSSNFILKDRENRTVPLTKEFKEFLKGYLRDRKGDGYCLSPSKGMGNGEYRVEFRRAFTNHMKRCGVVCTIHDMRRSFASNLVSHGVSVYKVARWLGDGTEVVERSYGHLSPADWDVDVLSSIPSAAIG